LLAVGDELGNINVYESSSKKQISEMKKDNATAIIDLQWSPDGVCLASIGNDKKIYFWALEK